MPPELAVDFSLCSESHLLCKSKTDTLFETVSFLSDFNACAS